MMVWEVCVGVWHYLKGKHEIEELLCASDTSQAFHLKYVKLWLWATAKSIIKVVFIWTYTWWLRNIENIMLIVNICL